MLLTQPGNPLCDALPVRRNLKVEDLAVDLCVRIIAAVLHPVVADDVDGVVFNLAQDSGTVACTDNQNTIVQAQTVEQLTACRRKRGPVLGQRTVQIKSDDFQHEADPPVVLGWCIKAKCVFPVTDPCPGGRRIGQGERIYFRTTFSVPSSSCSSRISPSCRRQRVPSFFFSFSHQMIMEPLPGNMVRISVIRRRIGSCSEGRRM